MLNGKYKYYAVGLECPYCGYFYTCNRRTEEGYLEDTLYMYKTTFSEDPLYCIRHLKTELEPKAIEYEKYLHMEEA